MGTTFSLHPHAHETPSLPPPPIPLLPARKGQTVGKEGNFETRDHDLATGSCHGTGISRAHIFFPRRTPETEGARLNVRGTSRTRHKTKHLKKKEGGGERPALNRLPKDEPVPTVRAGFSVKARRTGRNAAPSVYERSLSQVACTKEKKTI